jgi:hypothetical protein
MNTDRMQAFEDEAARLKLKGTRPDTERLLFLAGALALLAGVALVILGGIQVSGTTKAVDQTSYLATGTYIGFGLLIAGAALFVRYSMAKFLRFWLVRLVHEQRSDTDRLVEAIDKLTEAVRQPR